MYVGLLCKFLQLYLNDKLHYKYMTDVKVLKKIGEQIFLNKCIYREISYR